MLRPAKLFHSLHQLRHYVQTKVTELVVVQHPPSFLLGNPTASSTTPFAYQQTKPLTNGLQRQFPMINKACLPFLSGGGGGPLTSWRPLMAPATSAWHRSISLGINGGGYHHGLGAFRSYSSSTVSPFFQQAYHSATTQSSVFSHLSSGIFAPLANNIPSSSTKSNKTTLAPPCRLQQQQQQQPLKTNKGDSNKYNTQQLTSVTRSTSIEKTAAAAAINNDMATATTTSAMLCTEDELTTDMHSVTVPTTQTCFYITLDLVPTTLDSILSHSTSSSTTTTTTPWTKDVWPMFVKWKERQQDHYEQLLTWLQPCLDKGYRIQFEAGGSSLRLYFPKQVKRRDQAMVWLDELKHLGDGGDGDKNDFLALVELEQETIMVDEPLAPLGPDYFQGVQLFLSHIDDLIDHGPAFAQSCSVAV